MISFFKDGLILQKQCFRFIPELFENYEKQKDRM